jgi:creatinine amidohydrolase
MHLQLSTWPEIETRLQRDQSILIPIGSAEQHGPNGLIGTDALCPEIIATRAASSADILVGPTFAVGCAQHHLAFAGSITLRPSTMIAAMMDWTVSLRRHGFSRIYWLNGHGGNTATMQAAFAEIYAQRSMAVAPATVPEIFQRVRNWWELPGVRALCRELYPRGEGMHATASEVAVTYAGYPEQVRAVTMTPKIAPLGTFGDSEQYRAAFADGRIGSDPSQATPADGERIIALAAQALAADFEEFAAG